MHESPWYFNPRISMISIFISLQMKMDHVIWDLVNLGFFPHDTAIATGLIATKTI